MWHTHLKKRAKPGKTDLEEQSSGELSSPSSSTLTGEVSAMEDQAQFLPDLLEMDGEEWWPEEDDSDFWLRVLMVESDVCWR